MWYIPGENEGTVKIEKESLIVRMNKKVKKTAKKMWARLKKGIGYESYSLFTEKRVGNDEQVENEVTNRLNFTTEIKRVIYCLAKLTNNQISREKKLFMSRQKRIKVKHV